MPALCEMVKQEKKKTGWFDKKSYFSAEGDIDRNVARLAVSLSQAASQLEPNSDEIPTIVIDSTTT